MLSQSSENSKIIARNTFVLYVRMLFTVIISLYTARLVLDKLGAEDYGINNVVGGVVVMMWMFNGALQSSTVRYVTFELGRHNFEKLRRVLGNSLLIHVLLSIFILLICETVGLWFMCSQLKIPSDRYLAAQWVYQTSIISMIISVISVPFNAIIVAHEKMTVYSYISVLDVVLKLLIVFALDWGTQDKLIIYSLLMVVVQIIVQLCYVLYSLWNFDEVQLRLLYDKDIFKGMFVFASWNLVGSGSALVMTTGHNIILNQFFGPLVNAAKGIASTILSKVGSLSANFQMALNPQIYKSFAVGNIYYMHKLIFASSKFSYFLVYVISLPIIVECKNILTFWLKDVPDYTESFVRLLLLTTAVNALCNPQVVAAQATGNIKKFQIVESFVLLLILPLTWFFLKLGFSPIAAFYVYLVMHIAAVLIRSFLLKKMISLSLRTYLNYVILPILVVTVITFFLGFALDTLMEPVSFTKTIFVCLLIFIGTLIIVFYFGMQKNERRIIINKLHQIRILKLIMVWK